MQNLKTLKNLRENSTFTKQLPNYQTVTIQVSDKKGTFFQVAKNKESR